MFAGHYGVSYAAKAWRPAVPLWVLFVAVQLLDVVWSVLVLLGVEKVRIVPGITALSPLDLYYMPYTHSLPGALAWSVLAGLAFRWWERGAPGGFVVGAAVFSHWLLDLVVHRPDLPLIGDRFKVGLGLWNEPTLATVLEVVVLVGGVVLYLRSSARPDSAGTAAQLIFTGVLLTTQILLFFVYFPASPTSSALFALGAYVTFAAAAAWIEARYGPRPPGGRAS